MGSVKIYFLVFFKLLLVLFKNVLVLNLKSLENKIGLKKTGESFDRVIDKYEFNSDINLVIKRLLTAVF